MSVRIAAVAIFISILCPLIKTDVGSLSLSRRNSKYLIQPVYKHTNIPINYETQTNANIQDHRENDMLTQDGRLGRKVSNKQEKRQNLRKQNRQKSKEENEFNLKPSVKTNMIILTTDETMMTTESIPTTTTSDTGQQIVTLRTTTENFDTMLRSVLDYYRTEATTTKTEPTYVANERRSIADYEEYEEYEELEVEDRRLNDKSMPRVEKKGRKYEKIKGETDNDRKEWRKIKRLEARGKIDNDKPQLRLKKKESSKKKNSQDNSQKADARREMRKNKRKPGTESNAIDYTVGAKPGDRSEFRKIKRKEDRNKNKVGLKKYDIPPKHKHKVNTRNKKVPHYTFRDKRRQGMQTSTTHTSKYNRKGDGANVKYERKAERQRKRQTLKDRGNQGRDLKQSVESGSSQRGHAVSMFDLGMLKSQLFGKNETSKSVQTDRQANNGLVQISGTTAFDSFFGSFSTAVQNVFTVTLVAFSIALWVSVFVFWFNGADKRRDTQQYYNYAQGPYPGHGAPPPSPSGLRSRVARVLEYISPDSFEKMIKSIQPALSKLYFKPSLERMGTDALDGVGSFSNIATALIIGTAGTLTERMSGSVGAVSDLVGNKKIQDCLLQTMCYYSASHGKTREGRTGVRRMLEVFGLDNEFEGRKKNAKKDKRKKKMKKKLNTIEENLTDHKNDIGSDSYDNDDDLDTDDCEVFECNVVSLGHTAYSLYDRVSQLSAKWKGSD